MYYLEFPYLFASRLPEEFSVLEGNRVLLEVKTQDEEVRTDTLGSGFVWEQVRFSLKRRYIMVELQIHRAYSKFNEYNNHYSSTNLIIYSVENLGNLGAVDLQIWDFSQIWVEYGRAVKILARSIIWQPRSNFPSWPLRSSWSPDLNPFND